MHVLFVVRISSVGYVIESLLIIGYDSKVVQHGFFVNNVVNQPMPLFSMSPLYIDSGHITSYVGKVQYCSQLQL